jgi:hypothetical protein
MNRMPYAAMSLIVLCTRALTADTELVSAADRARQANAAPPPAECPVTSPNGDVPPGEQWSPGLHGNGRLWVSLWREGVVTFRPDGPGFVLEDGALQMKFPWWRGVRGPLAIDGRRLDSDAPPLRAWIPQGYGPSGFQSTAIIFPTPGCWEVTGRVGGTSLTFTVNVIKIGHGPLKNGLPPNARRSGR